MQLTSRDHRTIKHAHLFCGLGGGARGFNRATARVGNLTASFRCLGGIDVDAAAVKDFERLAGVPGTRLDLFDREQYTAFHGREPTAEWREATTADIHGAFGHEHPHIVFLSAPCKGFSGLLSEGKSKTAKYQALNQLTLRGIWLTLEAYAHTAPIPLILFENVPRIATRGRALLDQITALLRSYGYAVAETTHDCGELGGLAQSRKRLLLVARHMETVPPFLYEPPKRPMHGVGDVLGRLPLPGDPTAGPMHRVPALQWRTWVRLAFVEAGSDWRSLNRLRVEDGHLSDYALEPVTSDASPPISAIPVASPRYDAGGEYGQFGVQTMAETASTVRGVTSPIQGRFSIADPRHTGPDKFANVYRVVPWNRQSAAITSSHDVAVADPRATVAMFHNAYRTVRWTEPSRAITGQHAPSNGAICVADPRTRLARIKGDDWFGAGHYGVLPWTATSGAVSAAAGCDNGTWSVADPRIPAQSDRVVAVIRAMDGTWHRPFTTLELAGLQSLVDPEEHLELEGLSDSAWRERIGNAVPADAAQAIAKTMGRTLLMAWSGTGFMLSNVPIWARPMAVALAVQQVGDRAHARDL